VVPNAPAEQAGLRSGDVLLAARSVAASPSAKESVLEPLSTKRPLNVVLQDFGKLPSDLRAQGLLVQVRGQQGHTTRELTVLPRWDEGVQQWRIGVVFQYDFPQTFVRYAGVQALGYGLKQIWEMSALTLQLLKKMLLGEASLKNLSGPLTIADAAGQSAALGWKLYIGFIAAVSVSLAIFNLLPVPVLDGGHLLYYAAEGVIGKPISESVLEWGQKVGLALLLMLMSLALFNDLSRYLIN
jgi:regulator of sigma E protease